MHACMTSARVCARTASAVGPWRGLCAGKYRQRSAVVSNWQPAFDVTGRLGGLASVRRTLGWSCVAGCQLGRCAWTAPYATWGTCQVRMPPDPPLCAAGSACATLWFCCKLRNIPALDCKPCLRLIFVCSFPTSGGPVLCIDWKGAL